MVIRVQEGIKLRGQAGNIKDRRGSNLAPSLTTAHSNETKDTDTVARLSRPGICARVSGRVAAKFVCSLVDRPFLCTSKVQTWLICKKTGSKLVSLESPGACKSGGLNIKQFRGSGYNVSSTLSLDQADESRTF